MNEPDFLQRQSLSPSREKARSPADAMGLPLAKKIKKDEVTLRIFSSPITFYFQEIHTHVIVAENKPEDL